MAVNINIIVFRYVMQYCVVGTVNPRSTDFQSTNLCINWPVPPNLHRQLLENRS